MMDDVTKRTIHWQFVLVVLIPLVIIGLAWYLYFLGTQFIPNSRINKGELILPPASFQMMILNQSDSRFTLKGMEGRWGILVIGDAQCNDQLCQEALYQSRQAHIALGRDRGRVVRLFIAPETPSFLSDYIQSEHPGVIWLGSESSSVLKALRTPIWPIYHFYIVDPLGNIMMQYKHGQYGNDLFKDLQKLLKASNIG